MFSLVLFFVFLHDKAATYESYKKKKLTGDTTETPGWDRTDGIALCFSCRCVGDPPQAPKKGIPGTVLYMQQLAIRIRQHQGQNFSKANTKTKILLICRADQLSTTSRAQQHQLQQKQTLLSESQYDRHTHRVSMPPTNGDPAAPPASPARVRLTQRRHGSEANRTANTRTVVKKIKIKIK